MNLTMIGQLVVCPRCAYIILVERSLFGVNHTAGMTAVCWNCLTADEQAEAKKRYQLTVE